MTEDLNFVPYKESESKNIYCNWRGTWTVGSVNVRGTHVWLNPEAARLISLKEDRWEAYVKQWHEKTWNADIPGYFLGYDTVFQGENIGSIKDILEGRHEERFFVSESDLRRNMKLEPKVKNFNFGALSQKFKILVDDEEKPNDVWILFKKPLEEVLGELEEVQELAEDANVHFDMV